MYKSLFEKEISKTKWVLLAYLLVSYIALLSITSDLHYAFKTHGAIKYWLNVITYHSFYFEIFKFIPIIGGFALAILQFVPESLNKKYRLSFHLPINEKKLLLFYLLFGVVSILLINIVVMIGFIFISSRYFPHEIVTVSALSMMPWFIAGIIIYLGTATVTSEPNWFQKIVLGTMTFYSINLLIQEKLFCQYDNILGYYIILISLYIIIILFPGHRLRKGAK